MGSFRKSLKTKALDKLLLVKITAVTNFSEAPGV